jgi:hypothetical protein
MNKRERKVALQRKLASHRGAMGAIRKAHFEANGTLAGWRGRSSVRTDRRKQADKRACRQRVDTE